MMMQATGALGSSAMNSVAISARPTASVSASDASWPHDWIGQRKRKPSWDRTTSDIDTLFMLSSRLEPDETVYILDPKVDSDLIFLKPIGRVRLRFLRGKTRRR